MTGHRVARLLAWAVVVAVAAFAAAAAVAATPSAAPAGAAQGEASVGAEVYQVNCAACHGPDAEGTGTAPALGGVVDRLGRDGVEATIRDGRGAMPSFEASLDDAEIADVAAYLATLEEAEAGVDRGRGMMEGGHMMWNGMGAAGWVWSVLWTLVGVLVIVLVVLAVIALVRGGGRRAPEGQSGAGASAREVLDQRYARGDIDREAYLQARRDMGDPAD